MEALQQHDGEKLHHPEREHQLKGLQSHTSETEYVQYPEEDDMKVDVTGKLVEDNIPNQFRTLVWSLVKQVRPGVDLSRVTLPTFILEPRSMLEKMSDFLTHLELVEEITRLEDPLERMIHVIKLYVSGLYIRPKGVKKPYNPILGEIFRCMWHHPDGTKTFLVGEQVSHHPPVSAFYASNRSKGYVMNGSIQFKSIFTGASVGSILDGNIQIFLLKHQEEYVLTLPAAYATGFLSGTLVMEIGGTVKIQCEKTGYSAEIEFKRKPWIGGDYNVIEGSIFHDGTAVRTIKGKWDGQIAISSRNDPYHFEVLWEPSAERFSKRIRKQKPKQMKEHESDYLWGKVTHAIKKNDQELATVEKTSIENAQRSAVRMREEQGIEYLPMLFENVGGDVRRWRYKHINKAPFDPEHECVEYERDGIIFTRRNSHES